MYYIIRLVNDYFWEEGIKMAISYDGLWNVLNERGISKTEFRKLLNISTVTLAKMSKNEPVSMSIIESICLMFHCQIEEIMKIELKQNEGRWERIQENAVYLIRLFYLTEEYEGEEYVNFLYGYSIIADEGMERKRRWELSEYMKQGNIRVWEVTSYISGNDLWKLICAMEQNKKLGEFFEDSLLELHDNIRNKRKDDWRNIFLNAQITYSDKDYRPEIVLIPGRESELLIKGMQPLHAFGEEPLISESLVYSSKRKLYLDDNGNYDVHKMEIIYNFFKTERFLINGIKDLCRIGDFEVFSALVDKARQENLFKIESQVEEIDGIRKILKGFKITVFCEHLSGNYMLGVTTYNAGSSTSVKMYDIVVERQDVIRTVDIAESSSGVIVCIWEKEEEKRIQLIGYKQVSLMRDFFMDYHIHERTATIEDKYTKKFQKTNGGKNKNLVNRDIKRYSSMETYIGDEGNDPWRKEFRQVEDDFEELYGTEMAESRFFAQGMEAHEEFLEWLKNELKRKKIKSAWIFDPYIDADSVTRILRSVTDIGVQIKIVTDAKAPSRNKNERIAVLQCVCEQLGEIMGNQFSFYAFNGNKCLLHDRILMLFNQNYIPIVYNMSNSLDNMGMHMPSIVCKLNRNSAKKCAEYYLGLYQREQDEKKVQILWEKQNDSQRSYMTVSSEEKQGKYLENLTEFFNEKLVEQKLPTLSSKKDRIVFPNILECEEKRKMMKILCEDAGSYWEDICYLYANIDYPVCTELKKNLEDYYSQQWGERLQKDLVEELHREENEEGRKRGVLKAYQKDDFRDIMQNMKCLLENPHDVRTDYRLSWQSQMALEILIIKDFPRYQSVLEQLNKKEGSLQALKQKRTLVCRLACIMEEREELSEKLAERCLESENRELIAIGMQWFIKHRILGQVVAKVKDISCCHEFFKAMVVDLQVEDFRRKYRSDKGINSDKEQNGILEKEKKEFLEKMQEVKEAWVNYFSDSLTAEQLEVNAYFDEIGIRNKEDVCDLVIMLCRANKLSVIELEDFLIDYFLKKLEKDYKNEDGYWKIEDFQNGELVLSALKEFGTETVGKKVVEKLIFWEKKIVKTLHDVFLHHKNYTKWKCYIDMLIWCCTMRLLCQQFWENYMTWIQEDRNGQTRQKEIDGLLKKYHVTLQEYSDAYRIFCDVRQDFNG